MVVMSDIILFKKFVRSLSSALDIDIQQIIGYETNHLQVIKKFLQLLFIESIVIQPIPSLF